MIVVYGAGGHGREAMEILRSGGAGDDRPAGFLDDDPARHGQTLSGLPVLGGADWLRSADPKSTRVLVAAGTPRVARALTDRVRALGFPLARAISPLAFVSREAEIGDGALVFPFASIHTGARLGVGVTLNVGASASHDAVVGDFSNLNPGARLAGFARVGSDCYIGMGAQILPKVRVGDRAIVGAGAAVVEDLPADVTAVGVPARVVKGSS
jgi:sugar O-acyltransferase (sialic acid O-acetyltransferase NeuD family)